jgi:hypothetical protein
VKPDGGVGARRVNKVVASAIIEAQEKYTNLGVPILAIYAMPHDFAPP